jgi:Ni/Fe-hydrogenase subunit HybB-like protein
MTTASPSLHSPHHEEPAPQGGAFWNRATSAGALLVFIMVAVLAMRFVRGIGAVTNLNDGYPWGLWIAYDVVVGSALGAGGFTVAFLTYILNRGEFHPLVRPALLAALFGYVQAGVSVVVDIGRPWNAWHMVVPGFAQTNSVLFEVALCIMGYTCVLAVEFMPVVLERLGWDRPRRLLNRALFFFIALGMVLPMMHQSSLGSLLVVFGPQVHPLYQTTLLPLLFLSSCIGMGLAAVSFEGTLSAMALRRRHETEVLGKLMSIGRWVFLTYLVVRLADVTIRGVLPMAFSPSWVTASFWVENLLFLVPVVLMWSEKSRRSPQRIFIAACSMVAAGLLYRLSAYLVAYDTGAGWHYFPSLGELAVSVGLISFEVLAITAAIRWLPVLPKQPSGQPSGALARR